MEPEQEARRQEEVVAAARAIYLAWLRVFGLTERGCKLAIDAEAEGLKGARRLLPDPLPVIDPRSEGLKQFMRSGVEKGLATEEEAARALRGHE